ncbi:hypothetical protein ALP75_205604 [Pseudomonas syringae pv. actinidiae]|nr:hypothetical protein ALP75_205604 [Pseudomonas syringae pv. actinidiae]
MAQVAAVAHQVGQHQNDQRVFKRDVVNADDYRRAQHAEHLNRRPVEQDRSTDHQRGATRSAAEGSTDARFAVLVVIDPIGLRHRLRLAHVAFFAQLSDALMDLELRALLEFARHDRNDDGRDGREHEATLPANDRQQHGGQPCRNQRTDRPATLHQAVDEATTLGQTRVVGRGVDFAQVGRVDRFFGITQTAQRTNQDQRRLAPRSANGRERRTDCRTAHSENDTHAPSQAIYQRTDGQCHHRRADSDPSRDFGLFDLTPAKMPTDFR